MRIKNRTKPARDHFEFVPNDVFSQRNKSRVVQNEASFGSLEN